jgi:integrase
MLSDKSITAAIRNARTTGKPIKRFDGQGLHILAKPNGSTLWRLKFVLQGREKLISLGRYPEVTLKQARERRHKERTLVADGIDPVTVRQAARVATGNTVQLLAEEWLGKQTDLDPGTVYRHKRRLLKFIYPLMASRPIASVTVPELLAALRRIEAQGKLDTCKRVRELCSAIWRYAIATGRAERDIAADLRGALSARKPESHAAITDPKKLGELLRAIDGYIGHALTAGALKLAPILFVRPGELRGMEWSELDLAEGTWRIPASKMKMRDAHIVPLANQAIAVIRRLEPHSGGGLYVFPSLRTPERPMSENTINAALRRLGVSSNEHVGHGFRTTASILLNERGIEPDLIELQLAHKERSKSRAAYNRSIKLDERRKMMQDWADYLDKLRKGK